MAEVLMHPVWVFKADKREALLILKALGGRLTEEDAKEAKELCDLLTLQRAALAGDFARNLEHHASNIGG